MWHRLAKELFISLIETLMRVFFLVKIWVKVFKFVLFIHGQWLIFFPNRKKNLGFDQRSDLTCYRELPIQFTLDFTLLFLFNVGQQRDPICTQMWAFYSLMFEPRGPVARKYQHITHIF